MQVRKTQNTKKQLTNNIILSIEEYIKENNPDGTSVGAGTSFCEWVLHNIFELREDEVIEAMEISGKFDNGIDAVFEYNDELCVLQSKYNSAHKVDAVHRFIADCKRVVVDSPDTDREAVVRACRRISEAYSKDEVINCYYVTDNSFSKWEKEQIMKSINEAKKTHKSLKFYIFDFENILENIEIKNGGLPREFREITLDLNIGQHFEDMFETSVVGMVKLKDLADFVEKGGNMLFYSNIRNYLGKGTRINSGIKSTLEDTPDKFWYFNNGVTIVCEEFVNSRNTVRIKAPQIVNGCQTAKSLLHHFYGTKSQAANSQDGYLLVKIIETKKLGNDKDKKELRDNITRYTNSQNAVKGLDFYALDEFQRDLKNRLDVYGYYYEIQRGAFITESAVKQKSYKGHADYDYLLQGVRSTKKYCLPAKEVLQAFTAAVNLRPNIAYGRANELTPFGSEWDKIVNDKTKDMPLENFLFPYLLSKYAKESLGYKPGADDFRKNSVFLFLSTYYLFMLSVYNKVKGTNHEEVAEIADLNHINACISVFKNSALNIEIMDIIHDILSNFFEDSTIEDEIGDNRKGFVQNKMKRPSKFWNILERKIERAVNNVERKAIYKEISNCINEN
ncbi:AIPR family protein [Metabacillus rhizolycopersici]|uniref:AIPR family protein n=1 Tax=Metabacillus rhizolycopersici TaxID=2875709 RepID=A0ABS7UV51_9BACI|nr:AIPR family protein [Metabacillus rhizolycopersici]MBZ5752183.1 AIPR family protein [Metabacillus rhizolycopersici]